MLILNIIAILVISILSFRKEIYEETLEEQETLNQNCKNLNNANEDIMDFNQTKISLNKHPTEDSTANANKLNKGLEMNLHNNQDNQNNQDN